MVAPNFKKTADAAAKIKDFKSVNPTFQQLVRHGDQSECLRYSTIPVRILVVPIGFVVYSGMIGRIQRRRKKKVAGFALIIPTVVRLVGNRMVRLLVMRQAEN